MKHKTFIAVLAVAIVMMGCKVQKKSEVAAAKQDKVKANTVKPQKVAITRELLVNDVFIEFVGQAQPDAYDMVISWPVTQDRLRVSLDGKMAFAVDTSERQEETVLGLQGGRKVTILIEVLDQKDHLISSQVRPLEVPKDYLFSNRFQLTGDMKILNDRVFFNNSVVTTLNFNLEIKTKKLFVLDRSSTFEKSRIQNFADGAKAERGRNGRSGGLISIYAEVAEGELNVLMNSEAGGDALMGYYLKFTEFGSGTLMYDAVCPLGSNGLSAGRNGDLKVRIKDAKNFLFYPNETLSEGGKLAPQLGNDPKAPQTYPSMISGPVKLRDCPNVPVVGADATAGKRCIDLSGFPSSETNCE